VVGMATTTKGLQDEAMNQIEDRKLAEAIIKMTHKLGRLNDAVGNRQIRQEIDEHIVKIRLLARDGNLDNLNGGIK